MGNRLSKIVTRTGDAGETGLGDGSRIAKDSHRIHALGEVDELNSSLGVLLAEDLPDDVRTCLVDVQHDLFDLGGELCMPGFSAMSEAHVGRLEEAVGRFNQELTPLKEFILPGGTRAAALAHLSRTICRRVERHIVALGHQDPLGPFPRQYVNRLSDLLFILGRVINKRAGGGDVLWQKGKNR